MPDKQSPNQAPWHTAPAAIDAMHEIYRHRPCAGWPDQMTYGAEISPAPSKGNPATRPSVRALLTAVAVGMFTTWGVVAAIATIVKLVQAP